MILGTIKNYALILLAGLVGILAFLLTLLGSRSKRLEIEKEFLEARVNRNKVIAEKDNELEAQERSRRAEIKKELDEGASDFLANPNDGWLRDDTDDT